jgi:hypothetical protein
MGGRIVTSRSRGEIPRDDTRFRFPRIFEFKVGGGEDPRWKFEDARLFDLAPGPMQLMALVYSAIDGQVRSPVRVK